MSESNRYQRLRALFDQAADLPREERDRFLDRECGDDAEIRADLTRLFGTDDRETALANAMGRLAREAAVPAGEPEDLGSAQSETDPVEHRSSPRKSQSRPTTRPR